MSSNYHAGRDEFGGRAGSQASRVNIAIICGAVGTAAEIAEKIGETSEVVSTQLSALYQRGLVEREKDGSTYVYRRRDRQVSRARRSKYTWRKNDLVVTR